MFPTMFHFVHSLTINPPINHPPQKWLPQQSFSFLSNNLSLFYELTLQSKDIILSYP